MICLPDLVKLPLVQFASYPYVTLTGIKVTPVCNPQLNTIFFSPAPQGVVFKHLDVVMHDANALTDNVMASPSENAAEHSAFKGTCNVTAAAATTRPRIGGFFFLPWPKKGSLEPICYPMR